MPNPSSCSPCDCIPGNIGKDYAKQAILEVACQILSAVQVGPPVQESLIPGTDNTYDIGSLTNRWKDLYLAGDIFMANNKHIEWRNAANSAWINVIKADSSDNTVLNAQTGNTINLAINDVAKFKINGSNNILVEGSGSIIGDTSDGADNISFGFAGGGALNATRGSYIITNGNEHASAGSLTLGGGGTATAHVHLLLGHSSASIQFENTSGGVMWSVNNSGQLVQNGTNGSSLVFNQPSAKIIPGATSLLFRNNADGATNLSIADAGLVTVGVGDLTLTAGNLTFGAASAKIIPGATSLTIRNNADSIANYSFADGGTLTFGLTTGGSQAIVLQNNTFLGGKKAGGSIVNIIGLNTSDVTVAIGDSEVRFALGAGAGTGQWGITSGFIITNYRSANEITGAGSAALGANSPAVTNTAPYTWFKFKHSDGSTVYVPAWK